MVVLFQDVRYAVRALMKNPGLTLTVVITLALGIGANTVAFSFVYGMMFSPLGYPEQDRLVSICRARPSVGWTRSAISIPDFVDFQEQSHSFVDMGVYGAASRTLAGKDHPEQVSAVRASAGLLAALGIDAQIGRLFTPQEDRPGQDPVVVLSDSFWQRRFGGDPSAVGQVVQLDGIPHMVLGVLPPALERAWGDFDVWEAFAFDVNDHERGNSSYWAVGRLKPGVSVAQAQAELAGIAARLAQAHPETNEGWTADVTHLLDWIVEIEAKVALAALTAVVFLVLLIACANVANLLLAKASVRQREFAVRAALGASRWRLVRQMFTESTVLALAGGALGVLLAVWGVEAAVRVFPDNVPRKDQVDVNGHVLLFTLGVSILAAILSSLMPALKSSGAALSEVLKGGRRSASASGGTRTKRDALVVAQVAMALSLVICAGLMIRSFLSLRGVDPGFDQKNLLTMRLKLPDSRYESVQKCADFAKRMTDEIRRVPGVVAAGAVTSLPLDDQGGWQTVTIEGCSLPDADMRVGFGYSVITPGYFEAMGMPLLHGRGFNDLDREGGQGVVIVSENLGQRFWPNEDPIGKRLKYGGRDAEAPWRTVVGVVGNTKHTALNRSERLETYRPYAQVPYSYVTIVARTNGDPHAAASPVQRAVWGIDPQLAMYRVRSMEDIIYGKIGVWGVYAELLTVFALVALAMAAIGLYGVVSYTVSQRTHEISIRMTLGAQSRDVLRLIMKHSVLLTLLGVMVGTILAFFLGLVLESLMYGVSPADPATFVSVAAVLAGVALLATYLPARRATKIEPTVGLRCE